MRVRVDQSREDRAIAEIAIGFAISVFFNGDDAFTLDDDDAACDGISLDGKNPAGGKGPRCLFASRHGAVLPKRGDTGREADSFLIALSRQLLSIVRKRKRNADPSPS